MAIVGCGHRQAEVPAEPPKPEPVVRDPASDIPAAFSFSLSNRCDDAWRAAVVPAQEHHEHTLAATLVMNRDDKHIISMRVGDVLVLTSSGGGMTAIEFASWEQGEGARVEVVDDCTGVSKTYIRRSSDAGARGR